MSIVFSMNKQHENDIKLALSLQKPFIIDERIILKNIDVLYDKLTTTVDGSKVIYFDDVVKKIIYKAQTEGDHEIWLDDINQTINVSTVILGVGVGKNRKYIFEF
ncbi:hypothetical protein QT711_11175 [Sporosarcina saromensis]|uniref:Uncharacterized protein n=1 Tax=Sporosarcina saromensis TaxID=359365 RepID=A0ABU4G9T4_9BACL|nr:hypothetical protein [Sporosarcina saromensis]MDW0113749.1 hypothetical protein [Sporosarcina saromensis]